MENMTPKSNPSEASRFKGSIKPIENIEPDKLSQKIAEVIKNGFDYESSFINPQAWIDTNALGIKIKVEFSLKKNPNTILSFSAQGTKDTLENDIQEKIADTLAQVGDISGFQDITYMQITHGLYDEHDPTIERSLGHRTLVG